MGLGVGVGGMGTPCFDLAVSGCLTQPKDWEKEEKGRARAAWSKGRVTGAGMDANVWVRVWVRVRVGVRVRVPRLGRDGEVIPENICSITEGPGDFLRWSPSRVGKWSTDRG